MTDLWGQALNVGHDIKYSRDTWPGFLFVCCRYLLAGGRWIFSGPCAHKGLCRAGSRVPRWTRQMRSVYPTVMLQVKWSFLPQFCLAFFWKVPCFIFVPSPSLSCGSHCHSMGISGFSLRIPLFGNVTCIHLFTSSFSHLLIQQPWSSVENSKINTTVQYCSCLFRSWMFPRGQSITCLFPKNLRSLDITASLSFKLLTTVAI